ncbi:MAG: SIMPL domain-containing protein [Candidatus Levyibacteriota bacterium]|jgi:uncharacterized protein YggE
MKESLVGAIIVFFIALFVYTKLAGPIPFFINSVNTTKTDLFSSSGEGKVMAIPDEATVDAGVTAQSTTVTDAKNKVNQAANKIIADLKKLGIADKNIQTTDYSVSPNYANEQSGVMLPMLPSNGQQSIIGYTVTQNLEVQVQPIDKINQVVDLATKDGANLVGGVNFTFSDQLSKSLEQQATQQAVDNAKAKAQGLAKAAGINLGKIVNVVENSNQPQPLMMTANTAAKTDQSVPTNITPGENSLIVDVVLYYETY